MRRAINGKLHCQRGASLLLALLFTLAGAMVATMIVVAATTAAKRMYDDTAREQDYLTLESAAILLRDMLKETTYEVEESVTEDDPPVTAYAYLPGDGPLAQTICDAMERRLSDADPPYATVTVSAPAIASEDWELPFQPVVMNITKAERLEIDEKRISLEAEIAVSGKTQKLFLTAEAELQPESENAYGFSGATLKTRLERVENATGG